ncbi:MAG: coproporphyrinogen III oxidase, partial [Sulfurospirillum cavolei]|nr:coproporphyrinogen III oxidase [Sulfurospirillum cavolei]
MLKRFSSYFAQSMMQSKLKEALKIQRLDAPVTYDVDASKPYLLYMHVPFCHDFCPFCSFHKFKYDALNAKSYF